MATEIEIKYLPEKPLDAQTISSLLKKEKITLNNGARVELVLDLGVIVCQGRCEAINEIELELVSGGN